MCKGFPSSGTADGPVVDPDQVAVVADENFVGTGRAGPATDFLTRDPTAADADLNGNRPGRGGGYRHGI